jgi:hypothetical protein
MSTSYKRGNEGIDTIIERFAEKQISYGNAVSDYQMKNILNLITFLFYEKEENKPIVADILMGQGKTTAIVEYLKYKHEKDENFGCIVVKKTLDECNDFRLDLGFDKTKAVGLDNGIDFNEERNYIASVIRGFNFKDCKRFVAKSKGWGTRYNEADYDYRLCNGCYCEECPVKLSKKNSQKHRIILITHQRLFNSTDNEELINKLLEFENSKGELKKRQLLIIDEKIDMVNIGSVTYKDFSSLMNKVVKTNKDEYIRLFQNIYESLLNLEYPINMQSEILPQKNAIPEGLRMDENLINMLLYDKSTSFEDVHKISALQKILGGKNITTSIHYPTRDRQVSYYDYIDLRQYARLFDKTIILDATAKLDIDYSKGNIDFIGDVQYKNPNINLFYPKYKFKISKSDIIGTSIEFKNSIERETFYINNVQLLAKELKHIINYKLQGETLIVVYKSINSYDFREDINHELEQLKPSHEYKIIHHGEFSTGVNHLSNYENLIILGQLNKSHIYYQNKSLALGLDVSNYKDVQANDYLIQNIQQIGRTALRKGKSVNVAMLCDEPKLLESLKLYFNVQQFEYECISYKSELTALEKIIDAVNAVLINKGDIVLKRDICIKAGVKDSTLRKPYVKEALLDAGVATKQDNNRYLTKL